MNAETVYVGTGPNFSDFPTQYKGRPLWSRV